MKKNRSSPLRLGSFACSFSERVSSTPSTADSNIKLYIGRMHSGLVAIKISYIVFDFNNWLALEHGTQYGPTQDWAQLHTLYWSQWRGHQHCSNYVTSSAAASWTWRMQHLYKHNSYLDSFHKCNFPVFHQIKCSVLKLRMLSQG